MHDEADFLDTIQICIECLKYLVGLSPDLGAIPEGGIEKLAYHTIKKTEHRYHQPIIIILDL